MYAEFAKVAKEEGFDRLAYLFEAVGKIEKQHEERYLKLLNNVEKNEVFHKKRRQSGFVKSVDISMSVHLPLKSVRYAKRSRQNLKNCAGTIRRKYVVQTTCFFYADEKQGLIFHLSYFIVKSKSIVILYCYFCLVGV